MRHLIFASYYCSRYMKFANFAIFKKKITKLTCRENSMYKVPTDVSLTEIFDAEID